MPETPLPFTGTYHDGNYVWSIAMNLAWNELVEHQLGGSVRVDTHRPESREMVDALNTNIFTRELLDPAAYFIRSGMGPVELAAASAALLAEKQVETSLLNSMQLLPGELFAYARIAKTLRWKADFRQVVGMFSGQTVAAFSATGSALRGVELLDYGGNNSEQAVVRLTTEGDDDEIYLMAGYAPGREEEMIARVVADEWPYQNYFDGSDRLLVPEVNLEVARNYDDLIGLQLINPRVPQVFISDAKSETRFAMDHQGVRFVAEASIELTRSIPKKIIFDGPFLIVLKQTNQRLPYLIVGVNNLKPLRPLRTRKVSGRLF